MEWTLLLLLVPAIVAPMVLLWGYAGCSFEPGGYLPSEPENLMVTSATAGSISLSWTQDDDVIVTFEVERLKVGETTPVMLVTSEKSFTDQGLLPQTAYRHRVRAVYGGVTSEFSNQVETVTLPAFPCFSSTLMTDQPGVEGFCLVQRIEPSRLAASGSEVFITIRGSTVADLLIDRIYISQPAVGGDVYDSAPDLTAVMAAQVMVPANTAVALPGVRYSLDRTRPLLVIFDVAMTPGTGNLRYLNPVPNTEAVMYFRPATAEAAIADRQPSAGNPGAPPFEISNSIYLIERITVA